MDLVCTENAYNKSLVYSGTEALLEHSTDRSNYFQGQETYSFERAYVEFPSSWNLNSVSETAKELPNTCQTKAKYTKCQILYAKQKIP